jgi:hypothetical protein
MLSFEVIEEFWSKTIVAHAANHGNGRALPGRGDGLIGTLPTGNDLQVFATDRLTGLRKSRRPHNEICI